MTKKIGRIILKILVIPLLVLSLTASCGKELPLVPGDVSALTAAGCFPADCEHIDFYGRWNFSDERAPYSDWGAVYIRAAFEGPEISIDLDDNSNKFQYSVDGGAFSMLVSSGPGTYKLAEGLDEGPHDLLFVKRTSSKYGKTVFKGFRLKPGKCLLAPPAPKARLIEILGDSVTVGWADEGDTSTLLTSRDIENGYAAFGPVAARLLDADWMVTAKTGIGVYQNSCFYFETDGHSMLDYYKRTVSCEAAPWDFSARQPDAVVLAVGANDYLGYSTDPPQQVYEDAYAQLLSYVREKNPSAHIFVMLYYAGLCEEYTRNVAISMMASDPAIHLIDTINPAPWISDPQYFTNDMKHPQVSGHAVIGEKLADEIAAVMGW